MQRQHIITVPVYPADAAPKGVLESVWAELLSVYKDLRMWVAVSLREIERKEDKLSASVGVWSVKQLLDRPDIQPGLFHIHQRIRWFEKYPALHTLLVYRRCFDVVHYDNIKEIPSTSCFSQRQVDKVFKFVFNQAQNTRKGPPQGTRHGKQADPWSRSNPNHGSSDRSSKRRTPTNGGRSSYKKRGQEESHAPPPKNQQSHHTPPRSDNSQQNKKTFGSQSYAKPVDTRKWSLYDSLGVAKDSTRDKIVAAWKAKMRAHHPDRIGRANVANPKEWANVTLAGKVLKDAENRKRYDKNGDDDEVWLKTHARNPYLITIYDPGT